MGWFRSQVRYGAALALAALALNLAVAFGHHHFDTLRDPAPAAAQPLDGGQAHNDGHDNHAPAAAHPCFSCIVTAAAAISSSPPSLPLHGAMGVIATATPCVAELRHAARPAFEARAPPSA
jgi:hypothetical protein